MNNLDLSADNFVQGFTFTDYNVHIFRDELRNEFLARVTPDVGDIWHFGISREYFEYLSESREKLREGIARAVIDILEQKENLIKLRKKKLEELFCPRCGMKATNCYWHNYSSNGSCCDCNIHIYGQGSEAYELSPGVLLTPRSNAKEIESGDFIPYEGQYFYDTDHNTFKKIVAGEIVGCEEELMEPMGKGVCLPCWGKDS